MPKKADEPFEKVVLKGRNERWLITHWLDTKDKVPRVSVGLQFLDNKEMPPKYRFKPGGFALTKIEALELCEAITEATRTLPEPPEEEEEE